MDSTRPAEAPNLVQEAVRLAVDFHQQGQLDEAAKLYAGILDVEPAHFDALHLLGVVRQQQGHSADALALITRALQSDPASPAAHSNRGVALAALARHAEAVACFDHAIALQQDYAEAHYNRGEALAQIEPADAPAAYDHAVALRPDYIDALYGLGCVLQKLGRRDDAIAAFDKVLALDAAHIGALINRANVLVDLCRHREALACFDRALARDPHHPEAQWNRSLTLLALGDFEHGWKNYEWRWRRSKWAKKHATFRQPLWLGKTPVAGKTICLYAEQGFGDAIQFVRFVPLLARLGARIILEADPALHALFSRLPGVAALVAQDESRPDFDLHCPLLSLPLAFGVTPDSIPADIPYLAPSPERQSTWRDRLSDASRRIGLVWAGSAIHQNDRNRSIALERLAGLLSIPGIQVVSLQRDLRPADHELLQGTGAIHLGDELTDFDDTAAIVSMLDLVITVDTSVAHLAGALGKPVWILLPSNPDWRWMLDREDSPWYPTARLFRQRQRGDWDSVIARVRDQLMTAFVSK